MKTFKLSLMSLALFGLVACGSQPPPATPDSSAITPPLHAAIGANPAPSQAQSKLGDETFSLTSKSYRSCDATDGAFTAVANWDVTKMGVSQVSIFVEGQNSQKQLWLNGNATGSSTTGNWVFNNSRFLLMERDTNKLLAEIKVVFSPCN